MELRDFLVTPFFLVMILLVAVWIRPFLTDKKTRSYFFPALGLKLFGAMALGALYQFYYSGGDTYNFHTHGSRIIWEAFFDNPALGIKLFLNLGEVEPEMYKYVSQIPFYRDSSSFFLIRIAAFFDLFTFSTYSSTALCFALFSFLSSWYFFKAFYEMFPTLHRFLAWSIFFIPTVVIWGSGLLKDTITLGFLGLGTYGIKKIFMDRDYGFGKILLLVLSFLVIFYIKKYILLCFLPAVLFWIFSGNLAKVKSMVLKILIFPFVMGVAFLFAYLAVLRIGGDDPRYALDNLAETSRVTAYDIRFYTGKDAGSGYSLGELDGSFGNLLSLAPKAINVALFRPYLWEVKNPLMLLSALESFVFLLITFWVFFKKGFFKFKVLTNPHILFCFVFSITFAFAVGVSTFNFGTLSRYKIPLVPFFALGLVLVSHPNELNFRDLEGASEKDNI